ncbi:MAG TPA: hypothetical protein VJ810_02590 [Blastocatellia bacterium]|nr:hypothetical protein [Blastocatellia bacterium]
MNSFDSFTLAPMSAGDIIDRAVRIYRRNFLALLRIVIAPSLVAYAGSVLMSIGWSNATLSKGDARIVFAFLMIASGFLFWVIGKVAFYAVLGGSSRSLVAHFFESKPILARDVYRAVRDRIWSIIGATLIIGFMMAIVMLIAYFIIAIIVVIIALMITTIMPGWIQTVFTVIVTVIAVALFLTAALLVYSRIVYVPQILMVEDKGVFNSIGRSFSLAGGQIRRLAALVLFWIYVSWSVVVLLFLPLGYITDWTHPFSPVQPQWYDIGWQTVTQLSEILLMPIFMIGCTLLYLDSRVRKEGFDIELLANRTLAQPPMPPPLYPSRSAEAFTPQQNGQDSFATSILGLNDYSPPTAETVASPGAAVLPASAGEAVAGSATISTVAVEAPPQVVSVSETTVEVSRKSCRWCGAEGNIEDHFCRVCGSVY